MDPTALAPAAATPIAIVIVAATVTPSGNGLYAVVASPETARLLIVALVSALGALAAGLLAANISSGATRKAAQLSAETQDAVAQIQQLGQLFIALEGERRDDRKRQVQPLREHLGRIVASYGDVTDAMLAEKADTVRATRRRMDDDRLAFSDQRFQEIDDEPFTRAYTAFQEAQNDMEVWLGKHLDTPLSWSEESVQDGTITRTKQLRERLFDLNRAATAYVFRAPAGDIFREWRSRVRST